MNPYIFVAGGVAAFAVYLWAKGELPGWVLFVAIPCLALLVLPLL